MKDAHKRWLFLNLTSVVYYLAMSYLVSHAANLFYNEHEWSISFRLIAILAVIAMFAFSVKSLFLIQGMIEKYWHEYINPPIKSPEDAYWLRNESSAFIDKMMQVVWDDYINDGVFDRDQMCHDMEGVASTQGSNRLLDRKFPKYSDVTALRLRNLDQYFYLVVGVDGPRITLGVARLEEDINVDAFKKSVHYTSPYFKIRQRNVNPSTKR